MIINRQQTLLILITSFLLKTGHEKTFMFLIDSIDIYYMDDCREPANYKSCNSICISIGLKSWQHFYPVKCLGPLTPDYYTVVFSYLRHVLVKGWEAALGPDLALMDL